MLHSFPRTLYVNAARGQLKHTDGKQSFSFLDMNIGTPGPHIYIDLGTLSLNLYRCGDPHPYIYDRYGDPFIHLGTPTYGVSITPYIWGPRPQIYIPSYGDPSFHMYDSYWDPPSPYL